MGALADFQIRERLRMSGTDLRRLEIEPFQDYADPPMGPDLVPAGLDSYGYDPRLGGKHKVFINPHNGKIDPRRMDPKAFYDLEGDLELPAHSFALSETVERFLIPRDVIVVCCNKSTLARCGLVVNICPIDPEFRGKVTLELSNTTCLPICLRQGDGICKFVFIRGDAVCERSYADKKGRYLDQKGLTLPFIPLASA